MQNSMKYLATSTMQEVSSITIMPPEPMMEPMLRERFVIHRRIQVLFGGMQPPEGPPVCTALNCLPSGMPPPIS